MKAYLEQLVTEKLGNSMSVRLAVREYLQARLLQALQESGVFQNWTFLGGTALRFLYSLPRFSEDLDFSLVDPIEDPQIPRIVARIQRAFAAEGYSIVIKQKTERAVCSAFVKFPGLYHELGLSPHKDETLSVKLEVDTNPPAGANTSISVIRRHVTLRLLHHDKPSLLAGKLHAVLRRQYTKGRDLYDLIWYLADRDWPSPNLCWLNNALAQTGWKGPVLNTKNWREVVADRIRGIDWTHVANDLGPFLERTEDLALVTKANCLALLRGNRVE